MKESAREIKIFVGQGGGEKDFRGGTGEKIGGGGGGGGRERSWGTKASGEKGEQRISTGKGGKKISAMKRKMILGGGKGSEQGKGGERI